MISMCFRSNARTHWREAKIWVCRNPGIHPGAGHPGAGRPQPKPTRPTWTIRRPERKTACSERSDRRATAATCLVQLSHSHLHLCDVICDAMCVTPSARLHMTTGASRWASLFHVNSVANLFISPISSMLIFTDDHTCSASSAKHQVPREYGHAQPS